MHKITDDNIKFCDSYVRKLCRKLGRIADDDAIQAGRVGLCVAALKFDPEKSDNFNGFSSVWVRNELYRNRFGFNCTAKDAMGFGKKLVEFEDFRYSEDSAEKRVADRDLVDRCMDELTPKQQFIMTERFYNDKSCYDIAEEHGQTPQSYDLQYQKGRTKLRKKFRKEIVE